jgi:hypothetical protein
MNRLLAKLAIAGTAGSLLSVGPTAAQILPPASKAEHVEIIKGPELEFAREDLAIVRWISTNPGGDDEHFAVIHYGTDPKDLSQTAKSHIRLNRGHGETMFRVRVDDLSPQTTYYYTVTSMGADGESDGVQSPVRQFTTPAPGELTSKELGKGFRGSLLHGCGRGCFGRGSQRLRLGRLRGLPAGAVAACRGEAAPPGARL